MWDLKEAQVREIEAVRRGFTPRTHDEVKSNTPAQSAGSLIVEAISFVTKPINKVSEEKTALADWVNCEVTPQLPRSTPNFEVEEHRPIPTGKRSKPLGIMLPDFRIELLKGGRMPTKANTSDAGWDCYAAEEITIIPGKYTKVRLGFKLQIPDGWEVQIRGRSGLAANRGIISHFGTIDHLYRLELQAMLTLIRPNEERSDEELGHRLFPGDKVCQMVFAPVYSNRLLQVESVQPTDRGGFGSTGR